MPIFLPPYVTLSNTADILGILSFLISILIWIKSDRIKKELTCQINNYKKEQSEIKIKLAALRENIYTDKIMTVHIKSQIRTEILRFKKLFSLIITFEDKIKIFLIMRILNKKCDTDSIKLCQHLDYFIARLDKKENKL